MIAHWQKMRLPIMMAACLVLAIGSSSRGATSTDELGGATGKYDARTAAPDSLKTTKQGAKLAVTSGIPVPDRFSDQGLVRLTSKMGAVVAEFSGRSTNWGCVYTVYGKYIGVMMSDAPTTWTNTFKEESNPRIALEINESGTYDDVILGSGTGLLRIWVLGTTGTVNVSYSANPTEIVSGPPGGAVDVTAGDYTPTSVTLTGQTGGQTTITASAMVDGQPIRSSITVTVTTLAFRGKITFGDDFPGRSRTKLGVGETGTLGVELAPGTNLADLTPLTWTKTSGANFSIKNIKPSEGTAEFTAGNEYEEVVLTLTDKNGNQMTYNVTVIPPCGAYQVKGPVGRIADSCSATMFNYTYLLPKDVSFSQIKVNEGTCPGVGTDSMKNDKEVHPAWPPAEVSQGNIKTGCLVKGPNPPGAYETIHEFDWVTISESLDIGAGTFEWNIPWQYSIGTVSKKEFTRLLYRAVFDGNRSVTLSKGGPNGTVSTTQTAP